MARNHIEIISNFNSRWSESFIFGTIKFLEHSTFSKCTILDLYCYPYNTSKSIQCLKWILFDVYQSLMNLFTLRNLIHYGHNWIPHNLAIHNTRVEMGCMVGASNEKRHGNGKFYLMWRKESWTWYFYFNNEVPFVTMMMWISLVIGL